MVNEWEDGGVMDITRMREMVFRVTLGDVE